MWILSSLSACVHRPCTFRRAAQIFGGNRRDGTSSASSPAKKTKTRVARANYRRCESCHARRGRTPQEQDFGRTVFSRPDDIPKLCRRSLLSRTLFQNENTIQLE